MVKEEPFFRYTHYHTGFSRSESVNRNQGNKLSLMKMTIAGSRTFIITLQIIVSKFPKQFAIRFTIYHFCVVTSLFKLLSYHNYNRYHQYHYPLFFPFFFFFFFFFFSFFFFFFFFLLLLLLLSLLSLIIAMLQLFDDENDKLLGIQSRPIRVLSKI